MPPTASYTKLLLLLPLLFVIVVWWTYSSSSGVPHHGSDRDTWRSRGGSVSTAYSRSGAAAAASATTIELDSLDDAVVGDYVDDADDERAMSTEERLSTLSTAESRLTNMYAFGCEFRDTSRTAWQFNELVWRPIVMPMPRAHMRAVRLTHDILVIGCRRADPVHAVIDRFHIPTRQWTAAVVRLPKRLSHFEVATDGASIMYITGGLGSDEEVTDAFTVVTRDGPAHDLPPLLSPRYLHTSTWNAGNVYVFGGLYERYMQPVNSRQDSVEVFNGKKWKFQFQMGIFTRYLHSMVTLPGGKVIFLGGYDQYDESPKEVDQYSLDALSFHRLPLDWTMPYESLQPGVWFNGSHVLLAGGLQTANDVNHKMFAHVVHITTATAPATTAASGGGKDTKRAADGWKEMPSAIGGCVDFTTA